MAGIDFESRISRIIGSIQESEDIHPESKQHLQRFKRDRVIDGISYATLQKNLAHLKVLAEYLGPDKALESLDKEEIKDLLEWVHHRVCGQGDEGGVQEDSQGLPEVVQRW